MADWSTVWTALGAIVALLGWVFAGLNILVEVRGLRKQGDADMALKRTEFFLAQHRRLFDDKDLYEVLCYVDGDEEWLLNLEMWDKKRKFLTFIEEIALLVNSKKIEANVAYYMFGYYANQALAGKNFNVGIDAKDCHWWVFQRFCADAEKYLNSDEAIWRMPLKL